MPYTRVQMRRGTQTEWVTNNPTLAPGEFGLNLTNGKIKMGTGTIAWNNLEYFAESAYELAIRLGFEGTQEEWLLSIVGPPANITTGSVITGAAGTDVSISLNGSAPDYFIDFSIPQGIPGVAASISIGTVTTGEPEDPVSITNTGSSTEAVLNFTIPKGDTGDIGNLSADSPIIYSSSIISLDYDALVIDGGSA